MDSNEINPRPSKRPRLPAAATTAPPAAEIDHEKHQSLEYSNGQLRQNSSYLQGQVEMNEDCLALDDSDDSTLSTLSTLSSLKSSNPGDVSQEPFPETTPHDICSPRGCSLDLEKVIKSDSDSNDRHQSLKTPLKDVTNQKPSPVRPSAPQTPVGSVNLRSSSPSCGCEPLEKTVPSCHPASDGPGSSQYDVWNDYDQSDLDALDEIDAQYAIQSLQTNSDLVQPLGKIHGLSQETLPASHDQPKQTQNTLKLCQPTHSGEHAAALPIAEPHNEPKSEAECDLSRVGQNFTQSSNQLPSSNILNLPSKSPSATPPDQSFLQPRRTVSSIFQTGAGNPIPMEEDAEEPRMATQASVKKFRTPFRDSTIPPASQSNTTTYLKPAGPAFGFQTGRGEYITPPSEDSIKKALDLCETGTSKSFERTSRPPDPITLFSRGSDFLRHPDIPHNSRSREPQPTPPKSPDRGGNHGASISVGGFSTGSGAPIFIPPEAVEHARTRLDGSDMSRPVANPQPSRNEHNHPFQNISSVQSKSYGEAQVSLITKSNKPRQKIEDVFNDSGAKLFRTGPSTGRPTETYELNHQISTPIRREQGLNFAREDLHILSPIQDASPAPVRRISNRMHVGLTPQSMTNLNDRPGSRQRPFITPFKRQSEFHDNSPRSAQNSSLMTPANFKLHSALRDEKNLFNQASRPGTPYMISSKGYGRSNSSSSRRSVFDISKKAGPKTPMNVWLAPPRAFSPRQLLSLAIPESIVYMTAKSAAIWNFHAFTEPFGAIQALGELIETGCEFNLAKPRWVANHWGLIIWKLAGMIRWRPDFLLKLWNPENVLNQLKYRYEREFICGHRPIIKRILDHECPPNVPMCLVIVSINRQMVSRSNMIAKSSNGSLIDDDTYVLELSDGWYKIKATIDKVLQRVINRKKLRVGHKIALSGTGFESLSITSNTLSKSKEDNKNSKKNSNEVERNGESSEELRLHLEGNCTSRASWYEPLGFRSRPWFSSLRSVNHDGGKICMVDVLITETFPPMFISDDSNMGRWGLEQEKKLQESWEIEREKEANLILEERKKFKDRLMSVLDVMFEVSGNFDDDDDDDDDDDNVNLKDDEDEESNSLDLEDIYEELIEEDNSSESGGGNVSELLSKVKSSIKGLSIRSIIRLRALIEERLKIFERSQSDEVLKALDERIPMRRVRKIQLLKVQDFNQNTRPKTTSATTTMTMVKNEVRLKDEESIVTGQLLVQDLSLINDGFLKEGHRYWIQNLQPQKTSYWDFKGKTKEIFIGTRRDTRWREVSVGS